MSEAKMPNLVGAPMAALFSSSPGQWASTSLGVSTELENAASPSPLCAGHVLCPTMTSDRVCVCLQEIGDLLAPPSSVDDVAAAAVAHVLDAPKTTA